MKNDYKEYKLENKGTNGYNEAVAPYNIEQLVMRRSGTERGSAKKEDTFTALPWIVGDYLKATEEMVIMWNQSSEPQMIASSEDTPSDKRRKKIETLTSTDEGNGTLFPFIGRDIIQVMLLILLI